MKIKKVAIATLTALMSMGAASNPVVTASPNLAGSNNKIQPMNVPSAEARARLQQGSKQRQLSVRQNGGKNLSIARRNIEDKLLIEKGLVGEQSYIVELYGTPVVAQQAALLAKQVSSLGATEQVSSKAFTISGVALQSPTAAAQTADLLQQQDLVLQEAQSLVGRTLQVSQQYTRVLNGFSTKLTQEEAKRLAASGQVKRITRSKIYQLGTDAGPQQIQADKVWAGETVTSLPLKGEGVVVGVLDTGINTDHASFAPTGADGYTVVNPLGAGKFLGDCQISAFAERCNDKLIGVFSYKAITDTYKADEFQDPEKPWWEENIAIRPAFGEDYNGHGSHTASTAAGNVLVDVPLLGNSGAQGDGVDTGFHFPQLSGVAPHANIVAFQVCWPGSGGDPYAGCPGEALVAAVEDAVTAGVDVINFSIGGSEDSPWQSPLEQAFLAAHNAGIVVAASAGNSGSDGSSEIMGQIDHSSPWLMNVAASSHSRNIDISGKTMTGFTGGDSTPPEFTGKSISGEVTGPVVLAENFGNKLCTEPFAEGTFTHNEIVVCERGENARVAKATNVKAGGAGGFVLYNTSWDDTVAEGMTFNDVYPLPGIHLSAMDGDALKAWLSSGADHTATITASAITRTIDPSQADILANFSSRGPSTYVKEHLIPMVSAPGVDIYAANSDDQPFTAAGNSSDFTMMSGTSMASPHVAGALALLKQAHPTWSSSEIQNALQMTSEQTLRYKPYSWAEEFLDAGTYRAGSGRINVLSAINTGLTMHESVENFQAADPENGGAVRQLNMPELVNMQCRETCTWIRTFTAVRDGDWKVETETNELSFELSASPARFSLKKGETQTVVFTSKILDSQSNSHNSEQEVHGAVRLTADQPNMPPVYLPVAVKYTHGALPEALQITMNRNEGKHQLNNLVLPEMTQGVYSAAAAVPAQLRSVTLPQDIDFCGFACDKVISDSEDVSVIQVPADTARLVVEVLRRTSSTAKADEPWNAGDADVYIGLDVNGDGIPQWDTEAICMSISEQVTDHCNINNPQAGQYWVVVHNFIHDSMVRRTDSYDIATAIVPKAVSTDLQLVGPAQHDGMQAASATVSWNLPQAAEGDLFYSVLNFGSNPSQPSNIATVPLKLVRGGDEVSLATSQTAARPGQVVDLKLSMMANLDGYDRQIQVQSQLPAGVTLVPGSVKVPTAMKDGLTVAGNGFSLTTKQENALNRPRSYKITTNQTDMMCKTPDFGQSQPGKYVDLAEFGFNPQLGGSWNNNTVLDLAWYYGPNAKMALYNNFDNASSSQLTVSPMGYLQLDQMPLFFPQHFSMPFDGFPDQLVAPLWRGISWSLDNGLDGGILRTPLNIDIWDPKATSGISMGFTGDGRMIVEWDNARTTDTAYNEETMQIDYIDRGDNYDFEVIYNLNYLHGEGEYEIVMAYDHIDFAQEPGFGSIGVKGYDGFRGSFGPAAGYIGSQYALDNLKDKLVDDLVVCYDYVGPETSAFDVSFQVKVNNQAAGQALPISFVVNRDGLPTTTVTQNLAVNGDLKIGTLKDVVVNEDSGFQTINVAYSDDDQIANTISVTGDNVIAVVDGHTPGSTVQIKPAANFSGTTMVTVTVRDNEVGSDMASTTFKMTVVPTADAPVAKVSKTTLSIANGATATLDGSNSQDVDGDTLSYQWTGPGTIANANKAVATVTGLAAGTHQFTLTVSDGTHSNSTTMSVTVAEAVVVAPVPESKSGGAAGFALLLLLPFTWLRRRNKR